MGSRDIRAASGAIATSHGGIESLDGASDPTLYVGTTGRRPADGLTRRIDVDVAYPSRVVTGPAIVATLAMVITPRTM